MRVEKILPYCKNNIRSGRILLPIQPKRLPYNTFYAISFYRTTYFTMNTDSQPAFATQIRYINQSKASTVQTFTSAVNLIILPPFTHKGSLQKLLICQSLCRKSSTAFCPSGPDNCTSCTSTHSFTETMGTFALYIAGLKSSLTHSLISSFL